ncbi:MAG: hypothetical protein AB7T38_06985 [Nitrospirales bacterium]
MEALETFKEKNDEGGMAEAYHTFGNLYKNSGVSTPPNQGHLEGKFTFSERMELSKGYFEKAAQIYDHQHDFMGLTKSYFGIASVYGIQGEKFLACEWLEKSLEAYNNGVEKDPNARLPILGGWKDAREMIEAFKKKWSCQG